MVSHEQIVTVIVIEDVAYNWPPLSDWFSDGKLHKEEDYTFRAHESFPELNFTEDNFNAFEQVLTGEDAGDWLGLRGKALLFLDLGYSDEIEKAKNDCCDGKLREWLWSDTAVDDPPWFFRGESRSMACGMYLLGIALQNENWSGTICVATSRDKSSDGPVLKTARLLEEKWPRADIGIEYSDSISTRQNVDTVFKKGIAAIREHCKPAEYDTILWPERVRQWFDGHVLDQPVPHEAALADKKAKSAVSGYLAEVFGISPPDSWFEDDQYEHLHDEIKRLIGDHSKFMNHERRSVASLSLGHLVILLAMAARLHDAPSKWLEKIEWERGPRPILSDNQSAEEAKAVVESLVGPVGLFTKIQLHESDRFPLIHEVRLLENRLEIELHGMEVTELIRRLRESETDNGEVTGAVHEFHIKSACASGCWERYCVLNIRPMTQKQDSDPPQAIFEFRAC